MRTVSVEEAAATFSKLLAAVEQEGGILLICRDAKLVDRLEAAPPLQQRRFTGEPSLLVAPHPAMIRSSACTRTVPCVTAPERIAQP